MSANRFRGESDARKTIATVRARLNKVVDVFFRGHAAALATGPEIVVKTLRLASPCLRACNEQKWVGENGRNRRG